MIFELDLISPLSGLAVLFDNIESGGASYGAYVFLCTTLNFSSFFVLAFSGFFLKKGSIALGSSFFLITGFFVSTTISSSSSLLSFILLNKGSKRIIIVTDVSITSIKYVTQKPKPFIIIKEKAYPINPPNPE